MTRAERRFGIASTSEEVLAGIDLSGRVAVVTGAGGGIGLETARALASRGAHVVLALRDPAASAAACESVRKAGAGGAEAVALDLADLASVRRAAEQIAARHPALALLINNAGVMGCGFGLTRDGFEQHFGVNHLGHFVLTCRLVPALRRGAPARIVNLSSAGHRFSEIRFDDPNFARGDYEKFAAYGQSKTANVLFSVALDRRLRDSGVRAFSVHPGAIATRLGRHLVPEDMELMRARSPGGRIDFKTPSAGSATTCYAATAPELEARGGAYLEDCRIAPVADDPAAVTGVRSYAVDPAAAERLWALSEALVAERFPLA